MPTQDLAAPLIQEEVGLWNVGRAETARVVINSLGPRPIGISEHNDMSWAYQQPIEFFPGIIASIGMIAACILEEERSIMNAKIAAFARVAVNSLNPQPAGMSQQDYLLSFYQLLSL